MVSLLQIYFQYGDFTFLGGNSSNWVNFLITASGAFIGVLGALLIYYYQRHKQRTDTLRYATSLIESVIRSVKLKATHCKEYANTLRQNPTQLNLLHIEANQDLKRIVERLDQEGFHHAFIARYRTLFANKAKNATVYKNFKTIYSELDYIDDTIEQIHDFLSKELLVITDKKKKFVELFDLGQEKAVLLTVNPRFYQFAELMSFLNERLTSYVTNRNDREDLAYPLKEFIEPVIDFITGKYPTIPECNEIAFTLRKAAVTYNSILWQVENLANDFDQYASQLSDVAIKFESETNNLRNDFRESLMKPPKN
jgi:hypothetical protein